MKSAEDRAAELVKVDAEGLEGRCDVLIGDDRAGGNRTSRSATSVDAENRAKSGILSPPPSANTKPTCYVWNVWRCR